MTTRIATKVITDPRTGNKITAPGRASRRLTFASTAALRLPGK